MLDPVYILQNPTSFPESYCHYPCVLKWETDNTPTQTYTTRSLPNSNFHLTVPSFCFISRFFSPVPASFLFLFLDFCVPFICIFEIKEQILQSQKHK